MLPSQSKKACTIINIQHKLKKKVNSLTRLNKMADGPCSQVCITTFYPLRSSSEAIKRSAEDRLLSLLEAMYQESQESQEESGSADLGRCGTVCRPCIVLE